MKQYSRNSTFERFTFKWWIHNFISTNIYCFIVFHTFSFIVIASFYYNQENYHLDSWSMFFCMFYGKTFWRRFLWNIKSNSTPHRVVFIQNAILLLHYTGSIYQNYNLHVLLTFISFNFLAEDKNAFIYNIWYVFFLNTDWTSDKSWTFPWKYSERSDILRFRKLGRFFYPGWRIGQISCILGRKLWQVYTMFANGQQIFAVFTAHWTENVCEFSCRKEVVSLAFPYSIQRTVWIVQFLPYSGSNFFVRRKHDRSTELFL